MSAHRFTVAAWVTVVLGAPIVVLACLGDQNGSYVDATDIPPGGEPVNPYIVNCGLLDAGCYTLEETAQCCAGPGAMGGGTCVDAGAVCPAHSAAVFCNETADCDLDNFCCGTINATLDAGGNVSTVCATSCPAPKIQFCRTNKECNDGQSCVIQTCTDGQTYEMCGLFSPPGAVFTCKAQ